MKEGTYIRLARSKGFCFVWIGNNGRRRTFDPTEASAGRLARIVNRALEEGQGYVSLAAHTWEFRHRPRHILHRPAVLRLAQVAGELLDELDTHNGQKSENLLDAAAKLDNMLGELYGRGTVSRGD